MDGSYAIPITVGVVGHIDVITTEGHRNQISKLFCELASEYPNSPIYLFSSVAEGADRFVANIFLDLKKNNTDYSKRFELIIPTPFGPDEYKKDFNDESRNEFDRLLKEAKSTYCISCEEYKNDRPLQYLRAGKFVADSSLILIAFWDGEKGKKGGTADVVRHKIAGDDDNVAESTFEYDGSVFVLPCSRKKSSDQNIFAATDEITLSLGQVLKDSSIKETLEKIEEFNREALMMKTEDAEKSQSFLFTRKDKIDGPQNLLLKWYSIFDLLSQRYRRKDIRISVWLFVIGLFLIMSLEIYSNLFLIKIVLGCVMLFFVTAAVIYRVSHTQKNHERHLYNRTLAEGLRIQFYWKLAGINKNVSDYFLRIHRKDFTWVKHLLSAMYGITYNNRNITQETIKDLKENWISNQGSFFSSSIKTMTKRLAFYRMISNASFMVAFALLVSIFFFRDFSGKDKFHSYLLVVIGTLLGLFALIRGYIHLKGYEQLQNQYELMNVIYKRAESKIVETDTYDLTPEERNSYLKELFFVTGKEALIENGNWYLIFKEKEPEIEGI
jgi:hypothetical protein